MCSSCRISNVIVGLFVCDNYQEVFVGVIFYGIKYVFNSKGNGVISSRFVIYVADVFDNGQDIFFGVIVSEIEFCALIIGELYSSYFGINVRNFKSFGYVGNKFKYEAEIVVFNIVGVVNQKGDVYRVIIGFVVYYLFVSVEFLYQRFYIFRGVKLVGYVVREEVIISIDSLTEEI